MMVRTETQKLWYDVRHNDGEMYDLKADPLELDNLFALPEKSGVRRELYELMMHSRMSDDLAFSQLTDRERRIHREMKTAREPEIG